MLSIRNDHMTRREFVEHRNNAPITSPEIVELEKKLKKLEEKERNWTIAAYITFAFLYAGGIGFGLGGLVGAAIGAALGLIASLLVIASIAYIARKDQVKEAKAQEIELANFAKNPLP